MKKENKIVEFLGYAGELNFVYSFFKETVYSFNSTDFTKKNIMNKLGVEYINQFKVTTGKTVVYDIDAAMENIITSCKDAGIFDPRKIKGTGIFKDPMNPQELIINTGSKIWSTDKRKIDNRIVGKEVFEFGEEVAVYENTERLEQCEIDKIVKKFSEWSFRNGDLDLYCLLGWIANVPFAGIPGWISHMILTGVFQSGKSTLLEIVKKMLGGFALKFTGTSSEAGIRQQVGKNAVGLIMDETESKHKSMQDLLNLFRVASSGDTMVRGGADNKSSMTFNLRMSVLMAGIVPPNLTPSDRSRYIFIELDEVAARKEKTLEDLLFDDIISEINYEKIGEKIVKFMIDNYKILDDVAKVVNVILRKKGATERFASTYQKVLGSAFMLMNIDSINTRSFYKNDAKRIKDFDASDCMMYKKDISEYAEIDFKLQNHFMDKFNYIVLKEFIESFKLQDHIDESNEFSDENDLFNLILTTEIRETDLIKTDTILNHILAYSSNKSGYKQMLGKHGIRVEEENKEIYLVIDCNDNKLISVLRNSKFAAGDIKKVLIRHKDATNITKEISIGNMNRSRKGLIKIKLDKTIYSSTK